MKTLRIASLLALSLFFVAWAPTASAQDVVPAKEPATSPLQMSAMMFENGTYVKLTYHSPRRKGRTIFGELVPYGRRWRLGANNATEITTTGNLMFGGKRLNAGTYALSAIPGEDEWTIIVNNSLGQWGTRYDESMDEFRVQVPVTETAAIHEGLSIDLENGDSGAAMVITWEQTQVLVPITVR